MALATAPTPLYPSYAAQFGLSAAGTTLLFVTFAFGGLTGLAVMRSRLGDGLPVQRRIEMAGVLGAAAALVAGLLPGNETFAAARFLGGFGVGVAAANAATFIVDTARTTSRHTKSWSVSTPGFSMLGLAIGPAASGVLIGNGLLSRSALFIALGIVVLAATAWLRAMPPAAPTQIGQWPSGSPLPVSPFRTGVAALTAFSTTGIFGALTSDFLTRGSDRPSTSLIGLIAAVPFLFGALTATLHTRKGWWHVPLCGLGVLVVAVSIITSQALTFAVGAAIAGAGAGSLFGWALRTALASVPPVRHAKVAVATFIWAYTGLSVPTIALGLLIETISVPVMLGGFLGALIVSGAFLGVTGQKVCAA